MQYSLQVFEDERHEQFRTINFDGAPWFVLADVCRSLEIGNPSDAAKRLDDDEKDALDIIDPIGRSQRSTIVNESGLYSLILTSRKEAAKRFKKWVTSEVLPSIRRTGTYAAKANTPAFIRRFNENWDRIDVGHFSVISELAIRVWGRLELAGYVMKDRSASGQELRPDVSVGRGFADWLRTNHPQLETGFSYYMHKTPEWEGEARQYPNAIVHLFWQYVDTVWIPECADAYFKQRDPGALAYLPKLLPSPERPKQGMTRGRPRFKRAS